MRLISASPRRLRVLHIGGYWRGPNDVVRQMMLGLRGAGAKVVEYDTDEHLDSLDTEGAPYRRGGDRPVWLRWEHLADPVASVEPHLIICNAGGLSFRPEVSKELRRGSCLLGIALSDPDVHVASTSRIAPNFDYFATIAPACIPRYRAMGVPSGLVPLATNTDYFRPVPPTEEHRCDVLVLATARRERVEPVRVLCERFDTHLYGSGWERHGLDSRGLIHGDDLLAALSSASITVAFHRTAGGHPLVKHWLFDCLAAGTLVASSHYPEIGRYLRLDAELITFSSVDEMFAKVRHYLDHPEEADAIRRAGRARVLSDYAWTSAWPRFLRRVRDRTARAEREPR